MIVLQVWDTAGQERFMSISQLFFRDAHCALVCFDPSDETSVQGAKEWTGRVLEEVTECKLFAVMTKADKFEPGQIEAAMGNAKAELADVNFEKWFVTSAVTRSGVDALFEQVAEVPAPGVEVHLKAELPTESKCC
jgi:small GTP-binding protein